MSIVKPQACILTTPDKANELPLVVSHSNYKRIQVGGDNSESVLVGYQFFNSENADSYEKLLKQMGVFYRRMSITLPAEETPVRGKKRELTAEMIKRLRNESGLSMMECKMALIDANYDHDKALDLLQHVGRTRHRLTTCRH